MSQVDMFGRVWMRTPDGIEPFDDDEPTPADDHKRASILARISNQPIPGIEDNAGDAGWRKQWEAARAMALAAREGRA